MEFLVYAWGLLVGAYRAAEQHLLHIKLILALLLARQAGRILYVCSGSGLIEHVQVAVVPGADTLRLLTFPTVCFRRLKLEQPFRGLLSHLVGLYWAVLLDV